MTSVLSFGSAQKETSPEIYKKVDKWKQEEILWKSDQPKTTNTDVIENIIHKVSWGKGTVELEVDCVIRL